VELLVVVALIALLAGTVMMGPGFMAGNRMRSAATMIVSGVRLGLTRASSTGRPTRLAFDLDSGKVTLEEASSSVVLREQNKIGKSNTDTATELERQARAESEHILSGPVVPRPSFKPVAAFSATSGEAGPARPLGNGIDFISVQTDHDEEPHTSGHAYLYFFPGGTTERASVQLKRRGDDTGLTVMVSGLTGRAKIESGRVDLPAARSDGEPSERDEP